MEIQTMKSMKNEDITKPLNPYTQDYFRCGKSVENDFEVMWGVENDHIIIVDKLTGERVKITRTILYE